MAVSEYDSGTQAYLRDLCREDRRDFAFRGESPEAFDAWRRDARPALRELLGLTRMERERADFEPCVTLGESESLDGYTRRKGSIAVEPFFRVPFWFLRPDGEGPFPLAVFPHGHHPKDGLDFAAGVAGSPEMRQEIEDEDRDVAVQAVRRGFAAIAPSTRGFPPARVPDVGGRHGGSDCRSQLLHALLAGRTVIGERVWDLMRLVDWAFAREDVDGTTVLMMGNSGGGVATLYAAACDPRITVAVASCSYCSLAARSGRIHHCDCNAVPGILRFGEFWDVAGLICPRRLLVVHGRNDPLFPAEEVRRAVDNVRRIFEAAGAPEAFADVTGPDGHRFYSDLMWPFVCS